MDNSRQWGKVGCVKHRGRGNQADHPAACRCLIIWKDEHSKLEGMSRFPAKFVRDNQTIANRVFAAKQAGELQRAYGSMTEFCQLESMLSLSGCCGTSWDAIASGLDVSSGRGTEEGGKGLRIAEVRCGAMGAQVSAASKPC